jgi:hypothetical protein
MSSETDQGEIFDYVREYLKYWELNTSLEGFEEEIKRRVRVGVLRDRCR